VIVKCVGIRTLHVLDLIEIYIIDKSSFPLSKIETFLRAMSTSLQHTKLGELKGNIADGTAQFLGLKYATLKDRLATAELIDHYGSGPTDATKFGYDFMTTSIEVL
jgi:hypothetical protein